jgi:Nuclease-related domain
VRSTRRAGAGPQRTAKERVLEVFLLPRFMVAGCAILLMGAALFSFVFEVFPSDRTVSIFLLGAYVASVPWGLWNVALTMSGGASWRAGAEAEKWSGTELGLLGPKWRVEHGVPLSGHGARKWIADVDHVAIGPYGVLVAETKFSMSAVDLGSSPLEKKLQEALRQVERNANDIQKILGTDGSVPLIPVIIYWGPGVRPPDSVIRREGEIRVVCGADGNKWRTRIAEGGERVPEEVVERLTARLRDYIRQELAKG